MTDAKVTNQTLNLHSRLVTAPLTSWLPQTNPGAACDSAAYSAVIGQWWALGGNNVDRVNYTTDWGRTWSSTNIALDSLFVYSLDFDGSANVVVANDASTTLYDFTVSSSTWAHHTAKLIGTIRRPQVRYEPTGGTWVVFYCDTTSAMRLVTSTDRNTFTSQTLPASFVVAGSFNAKLGVGGGGAVIAVKLSGTTITLAQSTGTLVTWTGSSITAATITTLTDCSHPTYSADDGAWLISLYGTSASGGTTEIWRSIDGGLTWTRATTLSHSNAQVLQLANLGTGWAGLTVDGYILLSLDVGTTWYYAGMRVATPNATALSIWAGGGGLLCIDWGGAAPGARTSAVRLGTGGAPPLT